MDPRAGIEVGSIHWTPSGSQRLSRYLLCPAWGSRDEKTDDPGEGAPAGQRQVQVSDSRTPQSSLWPLACLPVGTPIYRGHFHPGPPSTLGRCMGHFPLQTCPSTRASWLLILPRVELPRPTRAPRPEGAPPARLRAAEDGAAAPRPCGQEARLLLSHHRTGNKAPDEGQGRVSAPLISVTVAL